MHVSIWRSYAVRGASPCWVTFESHGTQPANTSDASRSLVSTPQEKAPGVPITVLQARSPTRNATLLGPGNHVTARGDSLTAKPRSGVTAVHTAAPSPRIYTPEIGPTFPRAGRSEVASLPPRGCLGRPVGECCPRR